MLHVPVLIEEVLQYLHPQSNENFVDCTVGEAGHTLEILKQIQPGGKVIGIDLDEHQVANSTLSTKEFQERVVLVHDSYANITDILNKKNFKPVHGILLDLGMSSWQLERSSRGFTFSKNEQLDMRYDIENTLTAHIIVNEYPEKQIETILDEFGEEKFARKIASAIARVRKIKKIESTFELIDIIASAIPTFARRKSQGLSAWEKSQVGAKTFQALRIAVNDELGALSEGLQKGFEALEQGGRMAVISFHSLEDRIVKRFYKTKEKEGKAKLINKKPITAGKEEIKENPRARSAKLRVIEKMVTA